MYFIPRLITSPLNGILVSGQSPVFSASTMTSSDSNPKEIVKELKHLSLKRQQLLERRKIQCIFQELRLRAEFGQTGDV